MIIVCKVVSKETLRVFPQSVRKPFGKAGFGRITDDDRRCLVPCSTGLQSGFDLSHQGIVDDHTRFEA
jgi:hypothetical protein